MIERIRLPLLARAVRLHEALAAPVQTIASNELLDSHASPPKIEASVAADLLQRLRAIANDAPNARLIGRSHVLSSLRFGWLDS
jgi:hypothetical protein